MTIELKKGMRFKFEPTGVVRKIEKVTEKRVSWYTGFASVSAYNKKIERMAWVSVNQFQKGIEDGIYTLVN